MGRAKRWIVGALALYLLALVPVVLACASPAPVMPAAAHDCGDAAGPSLLCASARTLASASLHKGPECATSPDVAALPGAIPASVLSQCGAPPAHGAPNPPLASPPGTLHALAVLLRI
jgi:hypothetical protein